MLVGQQIGPFLVERELGSGAMGTVYKARFDKDGKVVPVALKLVSLGLLGNESAMARFDREAAILKAMRHPNIVRLFATGKFKKLPFIAMEYVDGETVDAVLERRGRIGWEQVVTWSKQLADALQHAHDKDVIHRDLKPSNLMLTKDGTLKLTDFGIAKGNDDLGLTGTNNTIGTAAYMSPEQCRGEKTLGARSDLYSFGIVMYELLTGRKPFTAENTVDMFLKHVNETPPRPRRLVQDIPVWLDNLVMFMMAKDKDLRPQDAATVRRMLNEIEEKVQNQQSVGAELANARRADRPLTDGPLDDEDREAARAIRGKKKKKKKVPLLQQTWVKAVALGVPLVAIAAALVVALKPPSLEAQYAAVEKATTPEAKLAAATAFLRQHGNASDDRAAKARDLYRDAKLKETEAQFAKRYGADGKLTMRKNPEPYDPEPYRNAMLAMDAEAAGDLKRAAELWTTVREAVPPPNVVEMISDEEANRPKLLFWLAEKRAHDASQTVPATLARLKEQIDKDRYLESTRPLSPTDPEALAIRAIRYEQFGDRNRSKKTWDALQAMAAQEPDLLTWRLLASSQIVGLGDPGKDDAAAAERVAKLQKESDRFEVLAAKAASDPNPAIPRRDVRIACREVIALYDDDPTPAIQTVVAKAKKFLDATPK